LYRDEILIEGVKKAIPEASRQYGDGRISLARVSDYMGVPPKEIDAPFRRAVNELGLHRQEDPSQAEYWDLLVPAQRQNRVI
jgi:hypothetical protein